jgi:lactoylglutathione lyase
VAQRVWAGDNGSMTPRARLVGFNHVALEVGDIEEALEFYGRLFELKLRGRGPGMAFIDAGDQFIALAEERTQAPDEHRHIGIVVDDKRSVRRALKELDVEILPGRGLDFLDPWGNRWQVIQYSDIQFTKAPEVLRGMGLGHLRKTEDAMEELRKKGLAPE